MRGIAALAFLGLFAAAPAATAAGCNDASTQSDLNICADQDFKAADKSLNDVYAEIVKRLSEDPDGHKRLVAAQRASIAYRDAECNFQTGNSIDGSIHPMLVAICRTAVTKKRTDELRIYLNCDEGGTFCPVPMP